MHPFKLLPFVDGETIKLKVRYGQVQRTTVFQDSAGADILAFSNVGVSVNSGKMASDPDPTIAPVGAISLSLSTTYGIWLKVSVRKSGWSYYDAPGEETIDATLVDFAANSTASIVADSTYTAESSASGITSTTSGFAYIYIGKVTVDVDGVVTVAQHRRSDVILPASLYTGHILSTDNSNDNALTLGTDQGLYLAPDAFVTGLTSAGGITVSDNGDGTWEVDDT